MFQRCILFKNYIIFFLFLIFFNSCKTSSEYQVNHTPNDIRQDYPSFFWVDESNSLDLNHSLAFYDENQLAMKFLNQKIRQLHEVAIRINSSVRALPVPKVVILKNSLNSTYAASVYSSACIPFRVSTVD